MACRQLFLLVVFVFLPAGSFVVLPTQHLTKVHQRGTPELGANILKPESGLATGRRQFSRGFSTYRRPQSTGVLGLGRQPASKVTEATRSTVQGERPLFTSDDGVSYLQNPDTGSEIWLVGVVHGKTASVELSQSVIREIKPQVVVLELDACRLDDLPQGTWMKTEDGLCWFIPEKEAEETASAAAKGGRDNELLDTLESKEAPFSIVSALAAKLFREALDAVDRMFGEDISEMGSAVLAAQACGAQVLLGDRDFEVRQPRISQQPVQVRMVAAPSTLVARVDNDQVVYVGVKRQETKRRLVAAGLVEDVDDERLDDPEALLHDSMSRSDKKVLARLRLRDPETRETAREYYRALESLCDKRVLSAMIPERDEVMARNLMALEGNQITVALVGVFHVDGIESILMENGWQFWQSPALE
ncbi:unnamed protein product [Pylaiella littoralis]